MVTVKEDGFRLLKGKIHIRAWEKIPDGKEMLVKDTTFDNLIVNVGKKSILKYLGGPTIACCADSGSVDEIGTGDSTTGAGAGDTDLIGTKAWKVISTSDKVFVCPTLFISVDFGYCCNNFTWNELGLRDTNDNLWARQVDCTPLIKTSSKRAIVEWQLSL